MHLFGGIHHLEIRREAANYLQSKFRIEVPDMLREFFAGNLIAFAAAYRASPGLFDKLEQILAALLADQVANHRAQHADVVAQSLVLVFEHDVLTAQDFVRATYHGLFLVGLFTAGQEVRLSNIFIDRAQILGRQSVASGQTMPDMFIASDNTPFASEVASMPGVSLLVDASSIVESAAAASCFRRHLFDLAAASLEVALTVGSSSLPAQHGAEFEFVFSLAAEAMRDAGSSPRKLSIVMESLTISPRTAWRMRCRHLRPGPLYFLCADPIPGHPNWKQIWDLRTTRSVNLLCAPYVMSPCRLLPAEPANCLIPGSALQAPMGSAWVACGIDVTELTRADGSIALATLDDAVRDAVQKGEAVHSCTRWPTARQRHDGWLNRRLAIDLRGIGALVRLRGQDPGSFEVLKEMAALLGRVRRTAQDESRRIAMTAGHVPAIEQANLAHSLPGGDLRDGWSKRWQLEVESSAVRHRNLVVLSPWSLLPPGEADLRHAHLLPLLRYADTCSLGSVPKLDHWTLREFRNFHQQATAALQQRGAAHQIAVPA